jgi:virulence factor Mce-like protein
VKRILAMTVVIGAALAVAFLGTGAGTDSGDYKVRAIFDNAVSVIPGEDVKIAGVKVGKIADLDVTSDRKAAVILRIDRPGFQDFREDATCTIRPQSLIGEKFVACTPTQPRPAGAQEPPPLQKIKDGDGKGQYLLPLSHTSTPVDIDLIQNIMRLPYRQRFSIILNELGVTFAGRGEDLKSVIKRANPGLQQTDKVLAILASQNKVLADLAKNSDTVLGPLARDRKQFAGFIDSAGRTAEATAERRADLAANFERFPEFLRQLTPTAQQLSNFADQAGPVFHDLRPIAPDVSRFFEALKPFSEASTPALTSLGDAFETGTPAVKALLPITKDLKAFSVPAKPVSKNLAGLTSSLSETHGLERFMDFLFFQVAAINGFDSIGHYLRAGFIVNTCSTYAVEPTVGCAATFTNGGKASSAAVRNGTDPNDTALVRTSALLRGEDPDKAAKNADAETTSGGAAAKTAEKPIKLPANLRSGGGKSTSSGSTTSTSTTGSSQSADDSIDASLFDYLFGGSK